MSTEQEGRKTQQEMPTPQETTKAQNRRRIAVIIVAPMMCSTCVNLILIIGTAIVWQTQICYTYNEDGDYVGSKYQGNLSEASCSIAVVRGDEPVGYYFSEEFLAKANGNFTCLKTADMNWGGSCCTNEDGSLGNDDNRAPLHSPGYDDLQKHLKEYTCKGLFEPPCELSCNEYIQVDAAGNDIEGTGRASKRKGIGMNTENPIVQTSWRKWGKDFGTMNGPAVSGSVSGNAAHVHGANVHGSTETHLSTTGTKDQVFPWGWLRRVDLVRADGRMFPAVVTYGIAIFGYIFLKTVKTLGMVTKIGVHLGGLEYHIGELFVSQQTMDRCYTVVEWSKIGLCMAAEYIAYTWAPNLAVYPLTSITQGSFVNTATMKGDAFLYDAVVLMLLVGVTSGGLIIIADKFFVNAKTGNWEGSNPLTRCLRCLTAFLRLLVVLVVGVCVLAFGFALSAEWKLVFGIDLSASFNFSFDFGLLGWASFLRFSMALQTIVEFVPSTYCDIVWLRDKVTAAVGAKECKKPTSEGETPDVAE